MYFKLLHFQVNFVASIIVVPIIIVQTICHLDNKKNERQIKNTTDRMKNHYGQGHVKTMLKTMLRAVPPKELHVLLTPGIPIGSERNTC